MARGRKSERRFGAGKALAALRGLWQGVDVERRKAAAGTCLKIFAWAAALAGVGVGLAVAQNYVLADPARSPVAVHLRLRELPVWMPDSIAVDIVRSSLPAGADLNDWDLTRKVHDAVAASPWVRKIVRVEKRVTDDPGLGVVEVFAEYHRPAARVPLREGGFAYVSEDAFRLPNEVPRYAARVAGRNGRADDIAYFLCEADAPAGAACVPVHYMIIDGVERDAPKVGRRWEGDDLVAGLKLVGVLRDRAYARQVKKVDVRNHAWRLSRNDTQISIIAHEDGGRETVIFFGHFADPEGDWVASAERRLANLDLFVANHGGALAGQAENINIQGWRLRWKPY